MNQEDFESILNSRLMTAMNESRPHHTRVSISDSLLEDVNLAAQLLGWSRSRVLYMCARVGAWALLESVNEKQEQIKGLQDES